MSLKRVDTVHAALRALIAESAFAAQDECRPRRFSAEQVSERLWRGMQDEESVRKAQRILSMLETEGVVDCYRDGKVRRYTTPDEIERAEACTWAQRDAEALKELTVEQWRTVVTTKADSLAASVRGLAPHCASAGKLRHIAFNLENAHEQFAQAWARIKAS